MDDSLVEDTGDTVDPIDALLDAPTIAPSSSSLDLQQKATDLAARQHSAFPPQTQCIDDYELLDEIARGSMGVVYRAKHSGLDRTVALKMILDSGDQTELSRKRFANEARAAASLDHPGIVPVYDVGSHDGRPYFTMAYVGGTNLAALLATGPFSANRSAEIALQIARAAAHAHQHGIVHRDLKPANVLIDEQGMPHVTDFGVSKSLRANCDLTSNGEVVGTPHYMPPEQAGSRGGEIQPASDVYSIGAILYAMLTGRPPFQAATPIEVISQVLTQDPVPTRALNPSVPVDLEVIALKCLSKSIRDRYVSADSLSDDLERYLRGEPIHAKPPRLDRRLLFLVRRHVVWASVSGTIAMALVLLTAVVAWSYLRARSQILDLEDNLAIAQQQVISERSLLKRFFAQQGEGQSDPLDTTRLELDRITNAFDLMLAAGKDDLALELAIESVRFAQENSIPIPSSSLEHLQASIATVEANLSSSDQVPTEFDAKA
ncbi:MAG: serine/threonine-protein kinase, partial [Rhodopirellula bahusiensis]